MNLSGQCHCGAVAYTVAGAPLQVLNCHCALCRTMNGSAFSTYVVVAARHLSFARGEADLASHAVTERTTKHFCRHCGTPLFNANPVTYPGLRMLHVGTVDGHAQLAPVMEIFCEGKLGWLDGLHALKRFPGAPQR